MYADGGTSHGHHTRFIHFKTKKASHRFSSSFLERQTDSLTSYRKNDRRSSTCSRSATCTTSTPIQSCNTSIRYRSRSNTNRSCSSLRRRKQSHASVSQPRQSVANIFSTLSIQSQSIERTVIRRTGVRVGSTRGGVAVSLTVRSASHVECFSFVRCACVRGPIDRLRAWFCRQNV